MGDEGDHRVAAAIMMSAIELAVVHFTKLMNYRHSGEGRNPAGLFNML
jgi:hypothetical protein